MNADHSPTPRPKIATAPDAAPWHRLLIAEYCTMVDEIQALSNALHERGFDPAAELSRVLRGEAP